MARKGLGKDVEPWFGPSTAAGAIMCVYITIVAPCMLTFLSNPRCKVSPQALGISFAVDDQIFQMDVYSASHPPTQSPRTRKLSCWGGRAVVDLIGVRLGIDGVNPIYYKTIKVGDSLPSFSRAFD